MGGDLGGGNNKASYVRVGLGGTKYNASTQMKNNVKAIMETLGWGGWVSI